jgi:asparagine synthase (glutamine-hydrolysing)
MCGFFIAFERGRPVDEARALRATQGVRHRGPDGAGHCAFTTTYSGPHGAVAVGCFFGHRRLSIIDVSDASSQPFRRRGRTLVYNGEVYNFRSLRGELTRQGIAFDTDGDTEVLFELVTHGGSAALREANGMWSYCLLDEAAGVLSAARDRHGKKPLFYYADATTFCAASEIAPIFAYLGRRPQFVAEELDSFLRYGWLFPRSDGRTHIRGVRQVAAGSVLNFDLATWKLVERRGFDLGAHSRTGRRDPAELAAIVKDAVLARLVADRKVGLLLSGGVDSSLILSVLHAEGLTHEVSCFTGDAGKSDDADYARQCVQQLGIDHINVPLDYGAGGIERFLQVCRHQEKPFPFIGNALAMPQLYERIADYDVPVVLDGTGGDEIFAGYWYRYYRFAIAEAIAAGDDRWLADSLAANADDATILAIADRAAHAARGAAVADAQQPGLVGARHDPADLDAFVRASVREAASSDPLERFRGTLAEALVEDTAHGRMHEWLWQNDRNSMMYGIENRSPLLDYRLLPYMHTGYRNKFVGAWNKHELRTLFSAFVPLPTQWRRDKQGFRWVYSRFLHQNRNDVLELIASSTLLRDRVDVDQLLERARSDDRYLGSSLLERMLCIAGLEHTMELGSVELAARKVA